MVDVGWAHVTGDLCTSIQPCTNSEPLPDTTLEEFLVDDTPYDVLPTPPPDTPTSFYRPLMLGCLVGMACIAYVWYKK